MVGLGAAAVVAIATLPSGIASSALAGSKSYGDPCPVQLPRGSEPVTLDPADFVDTIDNEYWPMTPGSRWLYREADTRGHVQKVDVEVTTRTRQVLGIDVTVILDVVSHRGALVEKTFDWYAQDVCGNVWYMGEKTKEYEDGQVVSTAGSWEAGVDGAYAGIAMPADPEVGLGYRQEYYAGEAEDAAEVLSIKEKAQVPYGHFGHVVLTKDTTPLHPRILEYKMYAKGIGPVLIMGVSGGSDREELVRFTPGA
jgi:hypothetical protein